MPTATKGRELTPAEVDAFNARLGMVHYLDELFLYFDADGVTFEDEVFGPVLVWRDASGAWHHVAVDPTWANEHDKPVYNSPLFPAGDDPFAWLKTAAFVGIVIAGVLVAREFRK